MEAKTKTLNIHYYANEDDYDLTIGVNLTIKDLKKAIEDLLDIKIKNLLKVKKGRRGGLVLLDDEKKTIEQYKLHNEDTIPINMDDVQGGEKRIKSYVLTLFKIKFL